MTIAAIAQLIATYGPSILPLVEKLVSDIEAGRGNQTVTAADVAELIRIAGNTSASLYAKAGVALPPAT